MADLVVFIAGAGQSATVWDEQIELLDDLPALTYAATDLAAPFDFDEAARNLHSKVIATGAKSVVVVGLSLGGMIATRYVAQYPDHVKGLVLSGSQIRPNPTLMRIQRAIFGMIPSRILPLPDGLSKKDFLTLLDAAGRLDLSPDVRSIKVPSLVLCGAKDRPNLSAAHELAATLPKSELQIIPNAGHELATDAPQAFAKLVHEVVSR